MKMSLQQALVLAGKHYQAGRLAETEMVCRAILQAWPDQDAAYMLLGLSALQRGDQAGAVRLFEQAVAVNPNSDQASLYLGIVAQAQGRLAEAEAHYQRVTSASPAAADALSNLAYTWQTQGRLKEAEIACRRAIQINPSHADAWNNLSATLGQLGRIGEAETACRQALAINANHAGALDNLAVALVGQTRYVEAEVICRRLLTLAPNYARAWNALGVVLGHQRRVEEAESACRNAVRLDPNLAEACNNLGMALRDQGRVEEAMEYFVKAVEALPGFAAAGSNALCCAQYLPDVTPERLLEEHMKWDRQHAEPLRSSWPAHSNDRDPDRPLRLGLISMDFGFHPVGQFTVRLLEALRGRCHTICYSSRRNPDLLTDRIKRACDEWCEAAGLLDPDLAERVRADRIDVLFDLSGHTAGNRMLAFARKPAPIQVTWMGYTGTTGLAAIDYLLADAHQVPPGAESYYREKVLRFDDDYICFEPMDNVPDVGPLPALAAGHVTFCSFNNPAKAGREVIRLWSRVLNRVPGSRMILKFNGFGARSTQERYSAWFAESGVDPARIEFSGWSDRGDLLAQYNRSDLALDTFPYSGGLTTCEAMWMGVPVVTCPGRTFASRHSLSHLSNAGLTEFVARDHDHYVQIAVDAVKNLDRLAKLRAGLRQQVAASPICDGRRLADNLLALLRQAWREWVARRRGPSA